MILDDPCSFRRGVTATAPAAPAAAAVEAESTPPTKTSRATVFTDDGGRGCSSSSGVAEHLTDAGVDAADVGAEAHCSASSSRAEGASPIETADPEASTPNGKRKLDGAGNVDEPLAQRKSKATVDRTRGRMRLTFGQKLEILQLLGEKKMTRLEIARIYKCSDRTVSNCFANRAALEAEAGSAARKLKSKGRRAVGFPEVDRRVLALVEAFRNKKIPVSRTTIASLGHAVKASLLCSGTIPPENKAKLMTFGASEKWAKNFVSRNGLVSKPILFPDGAVGGRRRLHKSLKEIQEEQKQYDLGSIGFDEAGPVPKRSYLSSSESRSTEQATPVEVKGVDV